MTLREALESGRWFRRASWRITSEPSEPYAFRIARGRLERARTDDLTRVRWSERCFGPSDVVADDWEFVGESTSLVRTPTSRLESRGAGRRLEHGVELRCCGVPCRLVGNLALRGAAGSPDTRLGYECTLCRRRLQVVDDWGQPNATQLAIYDETP